MTDNHLLHFLYSRITFSSHPILFHHLIIPSSHPLFQPVVIKKNPKTPVSSRYYFIQSNVFACNIKQPNPFSFFPFYFPLFIHASALFPHCFSVRFFSSFSLLFSLPILLSIFSFFLFFAHSLSFCLSFLHSSCIISQFPPTCTP
ncbi:hypothetical protein BKA57DRAFT_52835 [Linnemannia elongata]|nr:hypothetical protein BKA57DRAFT_52835 [Linnemannia elongata]